jgi:phosphatidylglycerophosphatase A
VAPGTWGSLPPAVAFGPLIYSGVSDIAVMVVMAVLVVIGAVTCVLCAPATIALRGKADPGEVVVDEFAGQALTLLVIPVLLPPALSTMQCCLVAGLGFLCFRIFDIAKPWPIRRLEHLPSGWGILADDVLAGVYAAIALGVCVRVGITG